MWRLEDLSVEPGVPFQPNIIQRTLPNEEFDDQNMPRPSKILHVASLLFPVMIRLVTNPSCNPSPNTPSIRAVKINMISIFRSRVAEEAERIHSNSLTY